MTRPRPVRILRIVHGRVLVGLHPMGKGKPTGPVELEKYRKTRCEQAKMPQPFRCGEIPYQCDGQYNCLLMINFAFDHLHTYVEEAMFMSGIGSYD